MFTSRNRLFFQRLAKLVKEEGSTGGDAEVKDSVGFSVQGLGGLGFRACGL